MAFGQAHFCAHACAQAVKTVRPPLTSAHLAFLFQFRLRGGLQVRSVGTLGPRSEVGTTKAYPGLALHMPHSWTRGGPTCFGPMAVPEDQARLGSAGVRLPSTFAQVRALSGQLA